MAKNGKQVDEQVKSKLTMVRAMRDQIAKAHEDAVDVVGEYNVPEFHAAYPVLNAICTAHTAPGVQAEGTTIVIWFESDGCHAILNPKELQAKAFFEGGSLNDLWDAMETFLTGERPKWRNQAGQRAKGHRRPSQSTSKPR